MEPWDQVLQEYNPENLCQSIRLQGQHWDQESGLYYNRYRYYDSGLGRYVTQNPIGLSGGMNIFLYSHLNPIVGMDNLGLFPGGGWMSSPSPSSGRVNTIRCMGGQAELFILPIPDADSSPAVGKFLQSHENVQRNDALRFNPQICRGKSNEVAVVYYNGDEGGGSATYTRDAELRAYAEQLQFLRGHIRSSMWCLLPKWNR